MMMMNGMGGGQGMNMGMGGMNQSMSMGMNGMNQGMGYMNGRDAYNQMGNMAMNNHGGMAKKNRRDSLHIPAHPDGESGGIRTPFRQYLDSVPETSGHLSVDLILR